MRRHLKQGAIIRAAHVRFGSKADIPSSKFDVCFTPNTEIAKRNRHVRFVPKADIAAPFAAADWIFVLRYLGQKAHEFPSSMSAPGQDIEPC
jgi:hypothetical protein